MATAEGKEQIRRAAKQIRDSIRGEERVHRSKAICEHLAAFLDEWDEQADVLTYLPYGSEPDLWPMIERMLGSGRRVFAPVIIAELGRMDFRRIHGKDDVERGWKNIPEPLEHLPLWEESAAKTVLVLPGLAFGADGGRIGYGGGYYDRFAARYGWTSSRSMPGLLRIGAVYSELVREGIPMEPHDLPVDAVVTEKGALVRGLAGIDSGSDSGTDADTNL